MKRGAWLDTSFALMPVYTGPPVPLGQHTTTVLDTAGPFARQQRHAPPEQRAAGQGPSNATVCSGQAAGREAQAPQPQACSADCGDAVLQTNDLSFSYPGIGARVHFPGYQLHAWRKRGCGPARTPSYAHPRAADGRPLPGVPPVVRNMSIQLPRGARCLLIGPNGAPRHTCRAGCLCRKNGTTALVPLHVRSCMRVEATELVTFKQPGPWPA